MFKVVPKMNKFEIKEYLEKIYDIPVKKVMTQNWMGRRKRLMGRYGLITYKRPDFKKVSGYTNEILEEKRTCRIIRASNCFLSLTPNDFPSGNYYH